jgi:hypothetical protein
VQYRPIGSHDYESVRLLLFEAGWQHRMAESEKFRLMINNSDRTVVAVEGSRVVGFVRALCDEVSNGYISGSEAKQNSDADALATSNTLPGMLIQMVLKTDPDNLRIENGQIVMK